MAPRIANTRLQIVYVTGLSLAGSSLLALSAAAYGISEPNQRRSIARTPASVSQRDRRATNDRAAEILLEADKRAESGLTEDLREALRGYDEACKAWKEVGDRRQYAITLLHYGRALRDLYDDGRSKASLNESLKIATEIGDDDTKAEALLLLSMLHMRAGDLKTAVDLSATGYFLAQNRKNQTLQSLAAVYLAEIFFNSGDMQKATDYAQVSLAISRQTGEKKNVSRALLALGYISTAIKDNQNAVRFLGESASMAREIGYVPGIVDSQTMLGHQYSSVGEKQRALEIYLAVQPDAERLRDPERLARLYAGLDFVNEELGDLDQSIEYCRRSIKLYRDAHYAVGEFQRYARLGKLLFQKGDYDDALENYSKALTFFRQSGMKNFVYYALSDIGEVYEARNGIADGKALDYYTQARQLMKAEEDPREYSYLLNKLGGINERTKGPLAALVFYKEALGLNQKTNDLFGEAGTQFNIARAQRSLNHLMEARSAIEAALQINERIRTEVGMSDLRASYFATVNQPFEFYIDLLMTNDTSPSNLSKALEISDRKRSRTLLDEIVANNLGTSKSIDQTLTERERNLKERINSARSEYAKRRLEPGSRVAINAAADELLKLSREYEQLRAVISSSSNQVTRYAQPSALTAPEMLSVVAEGDTILLEYSLADESSYLFVLTKDGIRTHKLPKRSLIENEIREMNRSIGLMTPDSTRDKQQITEGQLSFQVSLQRLSSLLLSPVTEQLAQVKKVVIVPDGALQYVPFNALPLSRLNGGIADSFNPLIATHEVSFVPSISVLVALRRRATELSPPAMKIAIIADPVFELDDERLRVSTGQLTAQTRKHSKGVLLSRALRDMNLDGNNHYLPRLLATQFEARNILSLVEPERSLVALNFEASRQLFLGERLKDYSILHLATHGFVDNEHPELSGVVLSLYDQQGRPQNGFVQLRDIYDMKLNAEMVVLSACQTALGKNVKGEGITGLTRAFMFAGSRRVVASLWKIDDSATAELMTSFYRHLLKEKLTTSAALRAAQIEISKERRWREPFYWAGFFISGDFN